MITPRRSVLALLFVLLLSPVQGTIYYVSHNAAGGGAGTVGDPYTMQEALDNVTAGNEIHAMNTGTYAPSAKYDIDTNTPSASANIILKGVASNGDDDGTVITVDGSGITTNYIFHYNLVAGKFVFENIRMTAATAGAVHVDDGDAIGVWFVNCEIDNAAADGVYVSDSAAATFFYDCKIHGNGSEGIGQVATTRGIHGLLNCSIYDNTSDGVKSAQIRWIVDCLFYGNGGDGLDVTGTTAFIVKNSTFFDNTGSGIHTVVNATPFIYSCILQDNGAYGIDADSSPVSNFRHLFNLGSNGNTSGHIDINSGTLPGSGHVLEDASFSSEITPDLTPTNSNFKLTQPFPAGATSGELWIGAVQPPETGGASSTGPLVGPGRLVR
jgi:hypothetical protein